VPTRSVENASGTCHKINTQLPQSVVGRCESQVNDTFSASGVFVCFILELFSVFQFKHKIM